MLRVLGIFGIVLGIGIIVATAAGAYHDEPARGYIVGAIIAAAGAFRFIRGMNR